MNIKYYLSKVGLAFLMAAFLSVPSVVCAQTEVVEVEDDEEEISLPEYAEYCRSLDKAEYHDLLGYAISAANNDCPSDTNDSLVLNSVEVAGDNVVFNYIALNDFHPAFNTPVEELKSQKLEQFTSMVDDLNGLTFLGALVLADKGVTIRVVSVDDLSSKDPVEYTLTNPELLLACLDGPIYNMEKPAVQPYFYQPNDRSDCIRELRRAVAATNDLTPQNIGTGLNMVSAALDDRSMVSTIECDESLMNIDVLIDNSETLSDNVLKSVPSMCQEPSERELMKLLAIANMCMKYIYKGATSGKGVEIEVSPFDIRKCLVFSF